MYYAKQSRNLKIVQLELQRRFEIRKIHTDFSLKSQALSPILYM